MTAAVNPAYRHYPKQCLPGTAIERSGARLKWYDIFADPIPAEIGVMARAAIETEVAAFGLDEDLGFVILHRCGSDFYFLLLQIWRGSNELWEAVYCKDGSRDRFAPFPAANPGPSQPLRPTFCVWELGAVAHEAKAWAAYLGSIRNEAAVSTYLDSQYEGAV